MATYREIKDAKATDKKASYQVCPTDLPPSTPPALTFSTSHALPPGPNGERRLRV